MKSDRVIDEIKERIDIVDFISGYVHLKKSGQNWKGICPFHAEKTPSFMVNPSKQIYHCFGCGAGGDVISFIVNHDSISFTEALQELAERAGITMQSVRRDNKAIEKDEQIRNALRDAAIYYTEKLRESPVASDYISKRGINKESVSLFMLGYAPKGWRNLLQRLGKSGYSEAILKEAGLVVIGEKGSYDMLRERIIFPIMAANGRVIAFGGRSLGESIPKYLNSPETNLFKKSETLYGIHAAKEAIRQNDQALITEGYMDVIMCHQYGFRNAIAPLGTAFTTGHARKIRKLTKNVVVVFDGDNAGISAAKRALPILVKSGLNAKILILPDGEDPDSFLKKHGGDAFKGFLSKAMSVVEFILSCPDGHGNAAMRELLKLIACMPDILDAEQMLMELAGKTNISESALREEFKKMRLGQPVKSEPKLHVKKTDRHIPEEEMLVSILIAYPEKMEKVLALVDPDMFSDKTAASLFRRMIERYKNSGFSGMPDNLGDDERLLYTRLSVEPGFDSEFVDKTIEDCSRKIRQKILEASFSRARASNDIKMLNALLLERKNLIKGKGT